MTSEHEQRFSVVKGNPSDADIAAIDKAFRQLSFEASTDTMPYVTNARNNWGDSSRQFDQIHAFAPTAYINLKD